MPNDSPKRPTALTRKVVTPTISVGVSVGTGLGYLAWTQVARFEGWQQPGVFLLAVAVATLAATVTLRWLLARNVHRPLRQVVDVMSACTLDFGAARVLPQRSRELQELSQTMNETLDRMRHNETKLRSVINAAADGIVTINQRGIIQTFNPAAEVMFGYPASAVIGRNISILMPEPHARKHDEYIARYVQTGVAKALGFAREMTARRANGVEFPISLKITEILIGNQPMFCGVIRDISEEKQTAQDLVLHATQLEQANLELAQAQYLAERATEVAEAASQSKSAFLANMSHEIRTPMTAILGYAENLQDASLSAEERDSAVSIIQRNGEHLMCLINDILDLSKIEAGKLAVEEIECSPVEIAREVANLMRGRARAKQLEFHVLCEVPLPKTIRSDPTRLRQVLINLCGNAIKFTQSGVVTLRMRRKRQPMGDWCLQCDIQDTGIGMTEEQLGRLFLPFQQADNSTTRRFGGTGLGLNISKRLAELLGGDITVESSPGWGTLFQVTVPTGWIPGMPVVSNLTQALPTAASETEAEKQALPTIKGHVLVADDGADNQRLVSFVLKKAGAEVSVADNGQMAVDMALQAEVEGRPFDLILMDMQMPIMDGYQAATALKNAGYPRPIVALTANAMAGDRDKCLRAGCDEFETKPIDRASLIRTLDRMIRDRVPPQA